MASYRCNIPYLFPIWSVYVDVECSLYVLFLLLTTCSVPRPLRRVDLETVDVTIRPAVPMMENSIRRAFWLSSGNLYGRTTSLPKELAAEANTVDLMEDATTGLPSTAPAVPGEKQQKY